MHPMQRSGADQHDLGLPIWVLPICLVLAAAACALVLTFAIRLMGESPVPVAPSAPVVSTP